MKLAQKQTQRLMEQNREPRSEHMYIRSINIPQRRQDNTMEKRRSLQ